MRERGDATRVHWLGACICDTAVSGGGPRTFDAVMCCLRSVAQALCDGLQALRSLRIVGKRHHCSLGLRGAVSAARQWRGFWTKKWHGFWKTKFENLGKDSKTVAESGPILDTKCNYKTSTRNWLQFLEVDINLYIKNHLAILGGLKKEG